MAEGAEHSTIAGVSPKVWSAFVVEMLVVAGVLFGTAGTLKWGAAWALLGLFAVAGFAITVSLSKADPALLEERLKVSRQPEQPGWDRTMMRLLFALMGVWLVVPGLDAVRFGWSHMAVPLQIAGALIMLASFWGSYRVMLQNTYLAPTVRLQAERGHKVISTGAYGAVRHPFYAVLLPFFPAMGLLLGSWWCVIASAPIIALLAVRAVREERHLARELDGYADYMDRVRFRLIPGVW